MKIAILMSTYNGEKYLEAQINSLVNQTLADLITLYIRDDGSTDKTFEIIDRWKKKIKIELIKGKNIGPGKSFWELVTREDIKADYYAFCDQDDIWDKNKIEIAVSKLKQSNHLYLCNCRLIDSTDKVIQEQLKIEEPKISIKRQFICGIAQGCAMVFTNEFRKYFLNKQITCIPMHDTVLILYAIEYGNIIWDSIPRFSYRVHEKNVVSKKNKSIFRQIITTYWNWKNGSKYSMSLVAQELLRNGRNLSKDEIEYLRLVANYKKSIKNKLILIFNSKDIKDISNRRAINSYRIRLLLNLF